MMRCFGGDRHSPIGDQAPIPHTSTGRALVNRASRPKQHEAAFALLSKSYLSSLAIQPRSNINEVVDFSRSTLLREYKEDLGTLKFPPLLRFYLRIGAKVSNTAVVDYDLKTIHVFTILTGIESVKYFRKLTLNN